MVKMGNVVVPFVPDTKQNETPVSALCAEFCPGPGTLIRQSLLSVGSQSLLLEPRCLRKSPRLRQPAASDVTAMATAGTARNPKI